METLTQNVYNFFSSNIYVITIVIVLTTIAVILEKSSKIATPITTIIKKSKEKKAREDQLYKNVEKILEGQRQLEEKIQLLERDVGHPSAPYQKLYTDAMAKLASVEDKVDILKQRVFENERDRIKAELAEYAARCSRKAKMFPEEFLHIEEIYSKYHDELHANSSGTANFNAINEYYHHQEWLQQ